MSVVREKISPSFYVYVYKKLYALNLYALKHHNNSNCAIDMIFPILE